MIILDTNVLSAIMRPVPDPQVLAWMNQQPRTSLWTTSVTVLELRFGVQIMPPGRRQSALVQALAAAMEKVEHRVAPFDLSAAQHAADLAALRKKQGRPGEFRDTMIAGIVLAYNASLATGNTAHFQDIQARIINPWTA